MPILRIKMGGEQGIEFVFLGSCEPKDNEVNPPMGLLLSTNGSGSGNHFSPE